MIYSKPLYSICVAFLFFIANQNLYAQTCPSTIKVGSSCSCHTCNGNIDIVTYDTYVKRVLPNEWLGCWGSQSGGMNSLMAGAVAIRSYTIPRISSYISSHGNGAYDICRTTCCQAYSTTQSSITNLAVDNTQDYVLTSGNSIQLAEYAAEQNNHSGCGDGFVGNGTSSWPCRPDNPCTGKTYNGHGRGMCQNGSARWATGLDVVSSTCSWLSSHGYGTKDWQEILSHYYPNWTLTTCGNSTPTPSNNNCTSAQQLTSNTSCNYISGDLTGATQSSLGPNNYCTVCSGAEICDGSTPYCNNASPDNYDVFYSFQAQSNTHTVTLSNYASNFDGVLELRSGCSFGCSNLIGGCDPTGTPSSVSITYNNLNPGVIYYIRVYEYNYMGTPPSSSTFDICVTHSCPNPVTPLITGNNQICQGESTTLSVSNTCSGCSYDWSNGDSGSSINVSDGGNYSVTTTNNCGGTASSSNYFVTENSPPNISISPSNPTICPGGIVCLTVAGASSYSYSWSNGQQGGFPPCISIPGTYSVTGTSSNGCTTTESVTVNQSSSPNVSISPSNPGFCPGESVTLTASGASTYSWNNNQNGSQITVSNAGNYSVTGTDNSGCTGTASENVSQYNAPSVSVSASPSTINSGGSSILSVSLSNAASYQWSEAGVNGSNPTVSPPSTTTYCVTVTDANGCTGTGCVTVEVVSTPPCQSSTITFSPLSPLQVDSSGGLQDFDLIFNPSGSNCNWNISMNDCSQMINNLSPTSGQGSSQTMTNISFNVTSNTSGAVRNCTLIITTGNNSYDYVLSQSGGSNCNLPIPQISTIDFPELQASLHQGVEYKWYKGNDPVALNQTYTPDTDGCYKVRISDEDDLNCFKESDTVCIELPTSINQSDIVQNLQIFPNPNTGQFHVSMETKTRQEIELSVVSVVGKEVYRSGNFEISGQHTQSINLENIASGMYLLKVNMGAQSITRKIFIQKN